MHWPRVQEVPPRANPRPCRQGGSRGDCLPWFGNRHPDPGHHQRPAGEMPHQGRLAQHQDSALRMLEFTQEADGRIDAVMGPDPDRAGQRVTVVQ